MKRFIHKIVFAGLLVLLFDCTHKGPIINLKPEELTGNYKGLLPCADCQGIAYSLMLSDENGDCFEEMVYLGKSNEKTNSMGKWWILNDSTIKTVFGNEEKQYLFKNDQLVLLDKRGEKIRSEFEDLYILRPDPRDRNAMPMSMGRMGMMSMPESPLLARFKGHGNEPGWSLEIDPEHGLSFNSMSSMDVYRDIKILAGQHENTTQIIGKAKGKKLVIELSKETCSDQMSDMMYETKVSIAVKSDLDEVLHEYTGCGEYLPDVRLHDIWVLTHVNHDKLNPGELNPNGAPRLEFYVKEKRLHGFSGCNDFNGTFEVNGFSVIQFGALEITKKNCPKMALENTMTNFLSGNELSYQIENLQLTLIDKSGHTFFFRKID